MYKSLKKSQPGQISVEASIIVPIVITVMASLIYMAFYSHDLVSVRSGAYSASIENESGQNLFPALFLVKPQLIKTEKLNQIELKLNIGTKRNINFINKIILSKEDESIRVQKTMNPEILYAARALTDTKNKGENEWK